MGWFRNLRIFHKLALGFGLMALLLLGLGYLGASGMGKIADNLDTLYQRDVYTVVHIKEANAELVKAARAMRNAMIYNTAAEGLEDHVKSMNQSVANFETEFKEGLARMPRDSAAVTGHVSTISQTLPLLKKTQAELVTMLRNGDIDQAKVHRGEVRKHENAIDDALTAIEKASISLMTATNDDSVAMYQAARAVILIVILVSLLLAVGLGLLIARMLSRDIGMAVEVAEAVARGDLTSKVQVETTNETGRLLQALKTMNENLLNIVKEVRGGTDSISTAAAQIASGNQDLSARTEHQASALEETASSMEELTSTVRQNSDNARQANQLAQSASEIATKGGTVMTDVVTTMSAINDSARKIVDIIGVIDSIAFQTNILALNAAVEAARAGEQGRGFAVVASEVRSLAQRSAGAAKEIKSLIDDSVEKVENGARLVDIAGNTMQDVVTSIARVTDIMGEISSASMEQSSGIEQVNQAVGQMDQVTQQNAALVEEAAAAAEALLDQARGLTKVVAAFKLDNALHVHPAPQAIAASAPTRPAPARTAALSKPAPKRAALSNGSGKSQDWEEF